MTLLLCAAIAAAALWVKYDSLDPCDWVMPALAAKAGVPEIVLAMLLPAGTSPQDVRHALAVMPRNECVRLWLHIQLDGGNPPNGHRL